MSHIVPYTRKLYRHSILLKTNIFIIFEKTLKKMWDVILINYISCLIWISLAICWSFMQKDYKVHLMISNKQTNKFLKFETYYRYFWNLVILAKVSLSCFFYKFAESSYLIMKKIETFIKLSRIWKIVISPNFKNICIHFS